MKHRITIHWLLCLTLLLTLSGCFASRPADIEAFTKPHEVVVTTENYILQPPDEIQIQCQQVPEINGREQIIRPDGKVSFENLGEFRIAGLTPAQASELIQAKAQEIYTLASDEPISVQVIVFESSWYYVVGEVAKPGPKVYTGRDNLLTALTEANLLVTAWQDKVQVIRPSHDPDEKPRIFNIDYKKMTRHGDLTKNVLLQQGDIVYVPPTVLAAIAQVVAEFVRPIGQALAPAVQVSQIATY